MSRHEKSAAKEPARKSKTKPRVRSSWTKQRDPSFEPEALKSSPRATASTSHKRTTPARRSDRSSAKEPANTAVIVEPRYRYYPEAAGVRLANTSPEVRRYDMVVVEPPRYRYYPEGAGVWAFGVFAVAVALLAIAAWVPKAPKESATP
jgi:hypothetical protein